MTGIFLGFLLSVAGASELAKQDLLQAYSEEVAELGGELEVELQWGNKSKNAHAARNGKIWKIIIGGRYLKNTQDDSALRVLLCHELGHHLGGVPYKFPGTGSNSWVSAEGQADYFAATECIPKLISNIELAKTAAEAFTQIIWAKNRKKHGPKPKLSQKSEVIVNQTLRNHPEPQCRLDTYLAGYSCPHGKDCRLPCWYSSP